MSDCNQDYYVMTFDQSLDNRQVYKMGYYGSERTHLMTNTHFNQPIRFDIDVDDDKKKDFITYTPENLILLRAYGLLFNNKIKEQLFTIFEQEDTIIHNAYIVSPDDKYFEGYWFLPTPNKPKNWLDKDKSSIEYDDEDPYEAFYVNSYHLHCPTLDIININQRQLITWASNDYGFTGHLVHRKLVTILKDYKRNLKFVPLMEFDVAMSMGGKSLPKSAI